MLMNDYVAALKAQEALANGTALPTPDISGTTVDAATQAMLDAAAAAGVTPGATTTPTLDAATQAILDAAAAAAAGQTTTPATAPATQTEPAATETTTTVPSVDATVNTTPITTQ